MDKYKIEETIASLDRIPAIPSAAMKLMDILEDPDTSLNDVVNTMDAAICVKVLSIANSAYYSRLRKVESIEHAVAVLGRNTIRDIVLGITIYSMFSMEYYDTAFDYNKYWQKNIVSTQLAMMLGKITKNPNMSKIYTIGLIHDIGEIVLFMYFREDYKKIQNLIDSNNLSPVEAEKNIFGLSHAEVGKLLSEKWNLPEDIARVLNYHEEPVKLKDDLDELRLGMIMHAADNLTNELLKSSEWEEIFKDDDRLKELFCSMSSNTNTLMKKMLKHAGDSPVIVLGNWASMINEELAIVSQAIKPVMETLLSGNKSKK